MKRIIRVFPRRTRATPTDDLAVVGREPELFDQADEVHVSVTFTWDLPLAEKLAEAWKPVAPVRIGWPATGRRARPCELSWVRRLAHDCKTHQIPFFDKTNPVFIRREYPKGMVK